MKSKYCSIKSEIKIQDDQQKMKKSCVRCGHSMTFYAFEKDTKVCSHCGLMNYRNKKIEFEYRLNKARINEKRN